MQHSIKNYPMWWLHIFHILGKLAKFQAKFKRVCCSTSVECYIIFLYIVAGFPEVSEISMSRWSNSVACRCQQAWRTWIRHLVPNHPQDWTLWIRGELPWHVLVFVLNITRINILLCKSEYDPFFGVAGSRCANSPLYRGFHLYLSELAFINQFYSIMTRLVGLSLAND